MLPSTNPCSIAPNSSSLRLQLPLWVILIRPEQHPLCDRSIGHSQLRLESKLFGRWASAPFTLSARGCSLLPNIDHVRVTCFLICCRTMQLVCNSLESDACLRVLMLALTMRYHIASAYLSRETPGPSIKQEMGGVTVHGSKLSPRSRCPQRHH